MEHYSTMTRTDTGVNFKCTLPSEREWTPKAIYWEIQFILKSGGKKTTENRSVVARCLGEGGKKEFLEMMMHLYCLTLMVAEARLHVFAKIRKWIPQIMNFTCKLIKELPNNILMIFKGVHNESVNYEDHTNKKICIEETLVGRHGL